MFLWHFVLFILYFTFNAVCVKSHVTKGKITDDEIDQNDGDENDDDKDVKRALQTGDIFTPMEMLPIAEKLLTKVRIGDSNSSNIEGRGIVSGSKSPEDLADRLFASYFMTARRIVILTDKDLSGLDALQALAISGEAVEMRYRGDSITEEPPLQTFDLNGQLIALENQPQRCRYKLIYKKVTPGEPVLRKGQKGTLRFDKMLKLEKHMRPNRHLIVNRKGPKKQKQNHKLRKGIKKQKQSHKLRNTQPENKGKLRMVKNNGGKKKRIIIHHTGRKMKDEKRKVRKLNSRQHKPQQNKAAPLARHVKLKRQSKPRHKNNRSKHLRNEYKHLRSKHNPLSTTKKPTCKWRYICKFPHELDSCRLHTSCSDDSGNMAKIDNEYVDAEEDIEKEKNELTMHFRKAFGLTKLDEDVEKIIEKHVFLIRPQNLSPDKKIETLEEYFNNIVMAEHYSTRPADPEMLSHPLIGSDEDKARRLRLEEELPEEIRKKLKVTKPLTPSDKKASTKPFNLQNTKKIKPIQKLLLSTVSIRQH